MAEITTIARPYAKAVFEFALERDELDRWSNALALAASFTSHEELRPLLDSPKIADADKAEAIAELCGEQIFAEAVNFLKLLGQQKRLPALAAVSEAFELLKAQQQQIIEVEVQSAFELSPEQEEKIAEGLRTKWNKQINLHSSVDQSLIGGVVVRAGDVVIDGSLRGKLDKLAEAVNS